MGQHVPGGQSVEEWLSLRRANWRQRVGAASFWLCALVVLLPDPHPLLFAAATLLSFAQQLMSLRVVKFGGAVSDSMLFVCNLCHAAAALAAAARGAGLGAAVRAAAPTVLEVYAINMAFAAVGKLNGAFFDYKVRLVPVPSGTHALTHSLAHSLTRSLTHRIVGDRSSLTHSRTRLLTRSLTHSTTR